MSNVVGQVTSGTWSPMNTTGLLVSGWKEVLTWRLLLLCLFL